MTEQQTTRSAWPDPPNYYKRYTDENLELLKEAKRTNSYPVEPIHTIIPEFYLQQLEPPPTPTEDYTVFDQTWPIDDHLPTLDELGVKHLFPETSFDRVKSLKKLNRALIVQFLELLDVLVHNPEEFGKNVENISTIFINMHHILNAYRPHQARETLKMKMENQLAKKRKETMEIREKNKEILAMLNTFGKQIQPLIMADDTIKLENSDTKMEEKTDRKDMDSSERVIHQKRAELMKLVDDII
ncbi:MED7 protein-domain-containing protein [Pilobolus umbonatus]|nr:MED7 protein-domain-containing protein [Pilobolus umbonatus]